MRGWLHAAVLSAAAVFLTTCGGGGGATQPTPPAASADRALSSVVVTGWTQPMQVGQQVDLTATAIYSDGSSQVVTDAANWMSSNTSVATVSKGIVTAVGDGSAAIIASYSGKDGNQGITVLQSAPAPAPSPSPLPTPVPNPSPGPSPPPSPSPPPGLACGTERWFVKTLSDADAAKVDVSSATPLSIKDLNAFAPHCSGLPETRAFSEEFRVFEVTGKITYVAHEDDRDYHIALQDLNDSTYTVVTELDDTACAGAVLSPDLGTLRTAEAMWSMLVGGHSLSSLVGTVVRVSGVGFYDFNHGQNGRSQNCIELHPILSIDRE